MFLTQSARHFAKLFLSFFIFILFLFCFLFLSFAVAVAIFSLPFLFSPRNSISFTLCSKTCSTAFPSHLSHHITWQRWHKTLRMSYFSIPKRGAWYHISRGSVKLTNWEPCPKSTTVRSPRKAALGFTLEISLLENLQASILNPKGVVLSLVDTSRDSALASHWWYHISMVTKNKQQIAFTSLRFSRCLIKISRSNGG